MLAHKIGYYSYNYHYFTVCTLQSTSFIVLLIKSTIVRNSDVIEVICFDWLLFFFGSTHSIFLMHSNLYFKIHLQYNFFQLYHIITTIFCDVTLFVVETIVIKNKVSQAIIFIWIQPFRFLHIVTTMHAHTIR